MPPENDLVQTESDNQAQEPQNPEPSPAEIAFVLGDQECLTIKAADDELRNAKFALVDVVLQQDVAKQRVQAANEQLLTLCRAMMTARGVALDGSAGQWTLDIDQGKLRRLG